MSKRHLCVARVSGQPNSLDPKTNSNVWLVVSGWPPKYSGNAVRVTSDQARKFRWHQAFGLDQSLHGTVVMLFGLVRVCVGERLPGFDFVQTAVVTFDLDTPQAVLNAIFGLLTGIHMGRPQGIRSQVPRCAVFTFASKNVKWAVSSELACMKSYSLTNSKSRRLREAALSDNALEPAS
jgi:hypothetical protein